MPKKVLDIITRYDASIAKLEVAEVARLNASLSASFNRLERDLRTQYPKLQSQGSLTVLQRKLLLSEQLKDTLTLLPESNNEAVRFQNTLQTASESGGRLADELVTARGAKYPLKEFSDIPIEAVAAQARDGVNRLYRYSEDFRTNASSVIEQGLIQGWGASKVGRALREQLGVTKSKAETIARTEIISALNTAATERYEANGIKYVQVFSTPSTRLCPICAARNGNVYPIGQVRLPFHPRCLVQGTVLAAPGAHTGTKRQYDGPVVTIETARGEKLTVTPNHPVLTDRGWIAAGALNESHYVLSSRDAKRVTRAIAPDKHNIPTVVEEVFTSLRMSSSMKTSSVKGSTEQFHGDGSDGKVNVVHSHRFLGGEVNLVSSEVIRERLLVFTKDFTNLFTPQSLATLDFVRDFTPPRSGMSRFDLSVSLGGCLSSPFDSLGFGRIPEFYSCFCENVADSTPDYSVFLAESLRTVTGSVSINNTTPNISVFGSESYIGFSRNKRFMLSGSSFDPASTNNVTEDLTVDTNSFSSILNRFSGQVFCDRVVKLSSSHYAGPVYNFETKTGWYFANNVITHNCRCLQVAWSPTWQRLGLTDDKFTLDYHNKGLAELAKQGLKPNYTGVSAFERYDKLLKPPTTTWKPGDGAGKVEPAPKVVKPKKEKTSANAPTSSQDFINLGRKQNAKYLEELATFPEQETKYFNQFKTACDEFGKDRKNDAKKAAFEQKRNEYTEFQNNKIARLSNVFSDWRQSLLAKGDARLASKWAATIDIDKSVEVARDANVIRKELEEYHRLTRGKVSGSLSRVFLDTDRAYAMSDDKVVNIGIQAYKIPGTDRFQVNQVQSKQTLFHEVSHLVEDSTPRYKQAANGWMRSRATSQTPEKLRVLTGIESYRDFEVALPDDFIDEYVGKIYPDGATEVLSMGMEHFASAESMQSLYLKDKDMFELMLGILEDD